MSQSRRQFLQSMVATSSVLSFTPALPSFLQRAAWAAESQGGREDRILVVLQLSGGNDGLNTVVPYADDVYGRSRTTLRLTGKEVLRIDDFLGLHPQMTGLRHLLDDGTLSIVQGVGYPNNNRGHDEAMREWHTAKPGELNCPTGWIGRAVDCQCGQGSADVPATFVGPIAQPFALRAEASVVPSVRQTRDLAVPAANAAKWLTDQTPPGDNPLLEVVVQASQRARHLGPQVEKVVAEIDRHDYPSFTLASHLKIVSQLIQAHVGIRIYFVELGGGGIGGFDNHANQRDNHAALLHEMSESIAAFVSDLRRQKRLDQVLLMTFSEFGRTVTENGRRGTNHGAAAPLFLVGGQVKGGVYGEHPSLTDLDQDAQKYKIDYRDVYATVLGDWLGYDSQQILGASYPSLTVLES